MTATLLTCGLLVAPASADGPDPLPDDPTDARLEIGRTVVTLDGGTAETQAAPGSATMVRTQVLGDPTIGDLDGDGDLDAVLLLVHQPGGSGSFYYLAAVMREEDGFRGTRAVLLGDRIAPGDVTVGHRVVIARFADRGPSEPMSAAPTIAVTRHLVAGRDGLVPAAAGIDDGELLHGLLVHGHEVRSVRPCGETEPLWLTGSAAMMERLARAYRRALPDADPYAPLFASLIGERVPAPADGFGADYDGGFEPRALVQTLPAETCLSDRVRVETPLPGSTVASPLVVRGLALGAWFFEAEVWLRVVDGNGATLARGFATAQAEWMTPGFVPFEGTIAFESGTGDRDIVLIVQRNNPSDNRDLDEAIEVPLRLR